MAGIKELVKLGLRAADDTGAKVVSQLDVALNQIANKGENRQLSRLEKELRKRGVKQLEIDQSGILKGDAPAKLGPEEIRGLSAGRLDTNQITPEEFTSWVTKAWEAGNPRVGELNRERLDLDEANKEFIPLLARINQGSIRLTPKDREEIRGLSAELGEEGQRFVREVSSEYADTTLPGTNFDTYTEDVVGNTSLPNLGQQSSHFDTSGYQFHSRGDILGKDHKPIEVLDLGGNTLGSFVEGSLGKKEVADLVRSAFKANLSVKYYLEDSEKAVIKSFLASGNMKEMVSEFGIGRIGRTVENYWNSNDLISSSEGQALRELTGTSTSVSTKGKSVRRVQEIQSDLENEALQAGADVVNLPYNFRAEALKQQLVAAANDGQEELWVAIKPEGVADLARSESVQKQYDTRVVNEVKKLAKKVGSKMRLEDGYAKIAIPAAGFSVPLYADDNGSASPLQAATPAGEAPPPNMVPKVQDLFSKGVEPSRISSMLTGKYGQEQANAIMMEALAPKIEELRAKGATDDQISSALSSAGLGQNQPSQAENIPGIGQPTLDQNQPTTEPQAQNTGPISETVQGQVQAETAIPINGTPEEIIGSINAIRQSWAQTGYSLLGQLDPEARAKSEAIQADTNAVMRKTLTEQGHNVQHIAKDGTVTLLDPQTGKPKVLESELLDSMIDSIRVASGEISAAVVGGVIGGAIGGAASGGLGTIPGAVVGSSVGAYAGRGYDMLVQASFLNYELGMQETFSSMEAAGLADMAGGILGSTLVMGAKATGSLITSSGPAQALARGYRFVVDGNIQGAYNAIKSGLDINDTRAVQLVEEWENVTGNYVLSEATRTGQKATDAEATKMIQILAETEPGVSDLVQAATKTAKSGGAKLRTSIGDRAQGVLDMANDITSDKALIATKQGLDSYVKATMTNFGDVKKIGTKLMDGTGYRFNFLEVPMIPIMKETKKKILNSQLRRDFTLYMDRIRQLGGADATELLNARARAQGPLPPDLKYSPVELEAANPMRDFRNLLEMKKVTNEFRADARFKGFVNQKAMDAAMKSIDKEIASAATTYMPKGKEWLKEWRKANNEYHKMKNLESNVLYKVFSNPRLSIDKGVKAVRESLSYQDPSTFMQVAGKLAPKDRAALEGSVMKQLVEKHSKHVVDKQALHFPALAQELNKMAFTQPKTRELKQIVNAMAVVFKNDPHLSIAAGNIPLPKFQNALTVDPTAKVKYAVASNLFHAMQARIPWSSNAGRMAAVSLLSKVLDNPLDAQTLKQLNKLLPEDPALTSSINQLAIQYAKTGQKENYGKVPLYSATLGKKSKARNTHLGKGQMYWTDKKTAKTIAKGVEGEFNKLDETLVLHTRLATLEDVKNLLGSDVSPEVLRSPEVAEKLIDKGFLGLTEGDKVLIFKQ